MHSGPSFNVCFGLVLLCLATLVHGTHIGRKVDQSILCVLCSVVPDTCSWLCCFAEIKQVRLSSWLSVQASCAIQLGPYVTCCCLKRFLRCLIEGIWASFAHQQCQHTCWMHVCGCVSRIIYHKKEQCILSSVLRVRLVRVLQHKLKMQTLYVDFSTWYVHILAQHVSEGCARTGADTGFGPTHTLPQLFNWPQDIAYALCSLYRHCISWVHFCLQLVPCMTGLLFVWQIFALLQW